MNWRRPRARETLRKDLKGPTRKTTTPGFLSKGLLSRARVSPTARTRVIMAQLVVPAVAALAGALAGKHITESRSGAKSEKNEETSVAFNADAHQNYDHEADARRHRHLAQQWPEARSSIVVVRVLSLFSLPPPRIASTDARPSVLPSVSPRRRDRSTRTTSRRRITGSRVTRTSSV